MSTTMRAKMQVLAVSPYADGEVLTLSAVAKDGTYPQDGSDEDNTFARWTPTADLTMDIRNPNLLGKFAVGQKFYVDFTEAPA